MILNILYSLYPSKQSYLKSYKANVIENKTMANNLDKRKEGKIGKICLLGQSI